VDNHVQTYKVTEDDGDRYAIVSVPYLFSGLSPEATSQRANWSLPDSDDDEAATVAKMKPADAEEEEGAADENDDIAVAKTGAASRSGSRTRPSCMRHEPPRRHLP
jgi:hypothetical protein